MILSEDAGAALKVLDFNENIADGTLKIEGVYKGMKPDDPLEGTLIARDFRVLNAPLFAQLLSVASITGVLDAMRGGGLPFSIMEVPFVSAKNVLRVDNARANGISIGVTATGNLDSKTGKINVEGTLIPAFIINSALGHLPIVGPLFSGGQKCGGVFVANFSIKGNVDKLVVTTNPLTALTPGFLRNIFKVFQRDEVKDSAAPKGKDLPANKSAP
ncbi:MAG: hypothetical protein HQ503_18500 [Rhodospirillales bacterium]|nr:hypothetical protein [Rhodospirillales bacterium]